MGSPTRVRMTVLNQVFIFFFLWRGGRLTFTGVPDDIRVASWIIDSLMRACATDAPRLTSPWLESSEKRRSCGAEAPRFGVPNIEAGANSNTQRPQKRSVVASKLESRHQIVLGYCCRGFRGWGAALRTGRTNDLERAERRPCYHGHGYVAPGLTRALARKARKQLRVPATQSRRRRSVPPPPQKKVCQVCMLFSGGLLTATAAAKAASGSLSSTTKLSS